MLLSNRQFFVKERVGLFKLTDAYDILDPQTQMPLGIARDEPPRWAKALRLVLKKYFLPTTIRIYEQEGNPVVLSLRKRPGIRPSVSLTDTDGKVLGTFKSKLFSLGGGFTVTDELGKTFAEVKGDWKGWNFRFLDTSGQELGVVTKKWTGLGKEMFTTADTYMIALNEKAACGAAQTALLLGAGLAIDIVFKER